MGTIIRDDCIQPSKDIYNKLLYYSVLGAIIPMVLTEIGSIFVTFNVFISSLGCQFIFMYIIIVYYCGKFFLWNYALMRLRAVFNNVSALRYSKRTLNSLQIIFIIAGIINISVACLSTNAHEENLDNDMKTCVNVPIQVNGFPVGVILPGFLDTNISFLCFYLFYRKMKQLYTSINDSGSNSERKENTQKDVELMYIVRKYLILLCAAILTSYLLLGAIATTALSETFGGIDTMINSWCLILFDKKYDNLYRKVFGCCAVSKTMKKYGTRRNRVRSQSHTTTTTKNGSGTKSTKIEIQLGDYMESNNQLTFDETEIDGSSTRGITNSDVTKGQVNAPGHGCTPVSNTLSVQLHGYGDAPSDKPTLIITENGTNESNV